MVITDFNNNKHDTVIHINTCDKETNESINNNQGLFQKVKACV